MLGALLERHRPRRAPDGRRGTVVSPRSRFWHKPRPRCEVHISAHALGLDTRFPCHAILIGSRCHHGQPWIIRPFAQYRHPPPDRPRAAGNRAAEKGDHDCNVSASRLRACPIIVRGGKAAERLVHSRASRISDINGDCVVFGSSLGRRVCHA